MKLRVLMFGDYSFPSTYHAKTPRFDQSFSKFQGLRHQKAGIRLVRELRTS